MNVKIIPWTALACAMGILAACDGPPHKEAVPPAAGASTVPGSGSVTDQTGSSGGPAGQTPSYGEPGAAPAQVKSQRDGAGDSASDSNPSNR